MEMADFYQKLVIREYKYWTLFLSEKQDPYLGRCYAWWRDRTLNEGKGLHPGNMPQEAWAELQTIFSDVCSYCTKLGYNIFYPLNFLLNTCYLSNEMGHGHHLHVHFIPRSRTPFLFTPLKHRIIDLCWGSNYQRALQHPLPLDQLFVIRDTMLGTSA